MGHLNSIHIENLECKSWVANELLDLLCCYDVPDNGLDKLILIFFKSRCLPFEEEVVSRLAKNCTNLSHLQLSNMFLLTEAARLSMVNLFRLIIQNSPPIQILNMTNFSDDKDKN